MGETRRFCSVAAACRRSVTSFRLFLVSSEGVMMYFRLIVLLALVSMPKLVLSQTCYTTIEEVGCDPEGYGYEENSCPINCTEADYINADGCRGVHTWQAKFPHFDDMDVVKHGSDWTADDMDEGAFLVCLKQGTCSCAEIIDTTTGEVVGYLCDAQDVSEAYTWEEWFPTYASSGCSS